jgi:prepilin peptidase CpaA
MRELFTLWTASDFGVSRTGVSIINTVLVVVLTICFFTDLRYSKIYNKVTFPAMAAGILLNGIFGGVTGASWALLGWAVGMGIQWIPFMMGFAKAGDVKLLAAVGALKGWAFCGFGFLYGAAVFGFILIPWLAWRGELGGVRDNLKAYFSTAAITQSIPDAPEPTVQKKYVPWAIGLCLGFFIALGFEIITGRVTSVNFTPQ